MSFKIDASDFNRITGITKDINKEVKKGIIAAVTDLTQGMEAESKKRAPVLTGNLRASIKGLPLKETNNTVSKGIVSEAEYSIYVEFGTGDTGKSNAVVYDGDGGVSYTKGWKGQKPQPYMRPAFEIAKQNINNIINKRLGGIN